MIPPVLAFVIDHQAAILIVLDLAVIVAIYREVCHRDRDLYPPRP